MNVSFAKYLKDDVIDTVVSIGAVIDGMDMLVPLDPANRHYAEIMRQVNEGTLVIQPAEEQS